MLKNYIKVALRNIRRHKFFSIINILGLTIGIAGALFVSMYIFDELTYDKFHSKADRIYRLNLHGRLGGQEIHTSNTSFPMSKAIVEEIPDVEESVRVKEMGEWVFRYEEMAFTEKAIFTADSNFFNVFDFYLKIGNPETALVKPNSIVLNETLAKKYFGDDNPLDKLLLIGNTKDSYIVTGVMEDVPGNSHLKFNALLSSSSFKWMNNGNWLSNSLWTYYVLSPTSTAKDVDAKLEPIMVRNVSPVLQQFMGKSMSEFRESGGIYEYFSQPMNDIHLYSEVQDEAEPPGDISYVLILAAIGVFIVVIACINFMNLTTAKSANRAKEVGLRKTLGSLRSTLIGQFLAESMIYAILAATLAVILVYILIPSFNTLAGKALSIEILAEPAIFFTLLGITLIVGILAGSYPAFYLTGFKITEVLKGKLKSGMKSGVIRSFLVTFQFWISIVLIICTGIVFQQLKYIQEKNLGFDKEHVLVVTDASRLDKNLSAFKNQIIANSNILGASYSNNTIPGVNNTTIFRAAGSEEDRIMATYFADVDHAQTLGFELAEGRFFSKDFPSDSLAVVINESAVRELGWTDPLNEKLMDFNGDNPVEKHVIGVAKDFNFESLKSFVRPLVLKYGDTGNILYVRFSGDKTQEVVSTVEATWSTLTDGEPLQYSYLDADFDALFRAEQRLGRVFTVFTVIAIFIACLGLFGLAAFTAEQRTKEIGVRKVMGASVWSITSLMSAEFTKLVILAFVLSIYPAYYAMDRWLAGFASRIDIGVTIFVVSGLVAIFIAWLTVSYQSLRAAKVNPVESLRYE